MFRFSIRDVLWLTVVVALGWQVVTGVAAAQKTSASSQALTSSEVLARMRQTLRAISSIQYDFRFEQVSPGATSNAAKYSQVGEFAWSEGKFYSKCSIRPEQGELHTCEAFDGELGQRLEDRVNEVVVYTKIPTLPYTGLQPILEPFRFLHWDMSRGHRFDLDTYREESIWNSSIEKPSLVAPRTVAGHECEVVQFDLAPAPGLTRHWEVCAAKDLDYYPIESSLLSDDGKKRMQSTMTVKELADLKTGTGRVIVPLRIEAEGHDPTRTLKATQVFTIDKLTLKVNEPIPKEKFYLKQPGWGVRFLADVKPEQQQRYEQGPR
jgi:hypothetical protein